MDQILNKDLTELHYIERIVFRKDVNTNKLWTFELENASEPSPTFVINGFEARGTIDSQTQDNATVDRSPISNAVFKIGLEKYC